MVKKNSNSIVINMNHISIRVYSPTINKNGNFWVVILEDNNSGAFDVSCFDAFSFMEEHIYRTIKNWFYDGDDNKLSEMRGKIKVSLETL